MQVTSVLLNDGESPFVFSQSYVQISASFADVRGLAVAAFELVYCSLSVRIGSSLSLTLVKRCRKVVIVFERHGCCKVVRSVQ